MNKLHRSRYINVVVSMMMAFLMLEDLYGTAEVVIFPQSFEKYKHILKEDEKVFIGYASVGKLSNLFEGFVKNLSLM